MRAVRAVLSLTLAISFLAGTLGCDLGKILLTDDELGAMYEFDFSQSGKGIQEGSIVDAAKPLSLGIARTERAPKPARIEIVLSSSAGTEAARLAFEEDGPQKAAGGSSILVKDLSAPLPPLLLPPGLAHGYYLLTVSAVGAAGNRLAFSTSVILLYSGQLPRIAIAAYPAGATAGRVSLFKLVSDFPADTQPWIRWLVDGEAAAFGPAADHADGFAWLAPGAAGMHVIKAEVFPFPPPVVAAVAPFAEAEFKAPVTAAVETRSPLDLNDSDFQAYLGLDGDFSLGGSAAGLSGPTVVGRPYPEAMGLSFGYALGDGAGLIVGADLMADLGRAPIAFYAEIAPHPKSPSGAAGFGSGSILDVVDESGRSRLSIGLADGKPYARVGERTLNAALSLPAAGTRLAVSFLPAGDALRIVFYRDNKPIGEGSLDVPAAKRSASYRSLIAGQDGLPAVYGALGVLDGAYPAYRLASLDGLDRQLIAASAFEGASLGPGLNLRGNASVGDGSVSLDPGAALVMSLADRRPGSSLAFSFALASGAAELVVPLDGGHTLSVTSQGLASVSGRLLGSVKMGNDALVSLQPVEGGLRLACGDQALEIAGYGLPSGGEALIRPYGAKPASVSRVLLASGDAASP